jgi:hypothetical protein
MIDKVTVDTAIKSNLSVFNCGKKRISTAFQETFRVLKNSAFFVPFAV